MPPYRAFAEPSQTARPVAIPRSGEMMAAAALWRRQRIVNAVGKIPGQVRTPVLGC